MSRRFYLLIILGFAVSSLSMQAQQQTNTNCTLSGHTADCTSNTTDYSARQQQSYEAGWQIGSAIGRGIALAMQAHSENKSMKWQAKTQAMYSCAAHPGEEWQSTRLSDGKVVASGYCPKPGEEQSKAKQEFLAHHREFKPSATNESALAAYIDYHDLNPRERKSYDHAYSALKKQGKLENM